MRILELFAGIGGLSEALSETCFDACSVVQAIDIDRTAKAVYELNFDAEYRIAEIASLKFHELRSYQADLWWMSPPCLPFTIRGNRDDLGDPRNHALLNLIDCITLAKPNCFVIENVPGFELSATFQRMAHQLSDAQYCYVVIDVCPAQFGWCNRRRRIYVVAWQEAFAGQDLLNARSLAISSEQIVKLKNIVQAISMKDQPELFLTQEIVDRYGSAFDRITWTDIEHASKASACFASSYGKTYLHAGSYLVCENGQLRRFSPYEVQLQLGFRKEFQWLDSLSNRSKWSLLGNSLSIQIVRSILRQLMAAVSA